MKLLIGCATDRGMIREKNQDRAICLKGTIGSNQVAICCVCDGIGSLENSECAAEMVTEGIRQWFNGIQEIFPQNIEKESLVNDLEFTIRELNDLVCEEKEQLLIELGCTMSIIFTIQKEFYIFHVGDSRIYCFRDLLTQITHDDVTMKSSSNGNVKNYLNNYIGKSRALFLNKINGTIEEQDVYILGSDGLYKQMIEQDLTTIRDIKNDSELQQKCKSLIETMILRGERDNISCAILFFKKDKTSFFLKRG